MEVLQWVADGCPDGVWKDFTYKHITYALAGRRLVTVDRRRQSWRPTITDGGRYYLEHGTYRPAEAPGSRRAACRAIGTAVAASLPAPASFVTADSLLAELKTAGGVLTIPDPPETVRAAYRWAIGRAITDGLVPNGYGLRHTGRDRDDLVIRLVSPDEEPARADRARLRPG